MTTNRYLLAFFKPPIAGEAKTRLGRSIGYSIAAELYHALLNDMASVFRSACSQVVPFAANNRSFPKNPWPECIIQEGANLGDRMIAAFDLAFSRGADAAVLVGTDIPDITPTIIRSAFSFLETKPAVIGPTIDGGYYCIGFTRLGFVREFFRDIDWSTNRVCVQTISAFGVHRVSYATLPELRDIDTADDLLAFASPDCLRGQWRRTRDTYDSTIASRLHPNTHTPGFDRILMKVLASIEADSVRFDVDSDGMAE